MATKFSDRIGITKPIPTLLLDDISPPLRASLWNVIHLFFENKKYDHWILLSKLTAQYFRKTPIDEIPSYDIQAREWAKGYFFSLSWYEVYNYIEFIANELSLTSSQRHDEFIQSSNHVLEVEGSGYRFIDGVLSPITSEAEMSEILEAGRNTEKFGLNGANAHIRTALALLSRKPEPDYRNSIKESISAVESVAKVLGKEDAQGLAGALAELTKKVPIHGALKSAFVSLYGYTSDEKGIRHAHLTDDSSVGFDEAKYMAVVCSAFVNYLISKANKAGLLTG